MNDDEKELVAERLCKRWRCLSSEYYRRKETDEIDDKLLTSIVLTYQLGHMSEVDFKNTVNRNQMEKHPQTALVAEQIDDMFIEAFDVEKLMHTDIDSFKRKMKRAIWLLDVDMETLDGST